MRQISFLPSLRRHAIGLVYLGLLAVILQTLAGAGVMLPSAGSAGDRFATEVCTSHGVLKLNLAQTGAGDSQPGTGAHDCCKQCATSGPLLALEIGNAVSPAPTFSAPLNQHASAYPALVAWTAHPPRGPPARA